MKFVSILLLPAFIMAATPSFAPRDLSFGESLPLLAGYQPLSSVVLGNIDLDHAEMGEHLARGTDKDFEKAKGVYEEGANAKPYAILSLQKPLEVDLKNGMVVAGETPTGLTATGTILGDYPPGASQIALIYSAGTQDCSVGASSYPVVQGCLKPAGSIFVQDLQSVTLPYTYDPIEDNQNRMSLQKLSTHAKDKMYACEHCPFWLYSHYVNYYGSFSYADQWIQAAFDGGKTSLDKGNGNFQYYSYGARADAIQKATVYMNLWMTVQNELSTAVVQCQDDCRDGNCNQESLHSWDLAVAFYAGSLEGTQVLGSGNGRLLHKLADKRCVSFHTCNGYHGLSSVNDEMFQLFLAGQHGIRTGKCSAAHDIKDRISSLLIVPLMQETLWHAHITDFKPQEIVSKDEDAQKISAGTATAAAAILPLIHNCDPQAASTVYENLKTGHEANFAQVKSALEGTYDCLGITCEDVGGLYYATTGTYVPGAEPCGNAGDKIAGRVSNRHSNGRSAGDVTLIVFGTLLGAIVLFSMCYWLSGFTITKKEVTKSPPPPPSPTAFENNTNTEGEDQEALKVEEGDFA